MSAINCPNNLGAACGYQTCVIANQTSGGGGLPKWVYYANDIPNVSSNAIIYADSCFGNQTQFSILNTAGITAVTWNFGDPISGANNTAVGFTANHTFSQIGNYNVQAIITNACGTDTLFYNALPIINCTPSNKITGFKIIGDTCDFATNFTFQSIGTTNSNVLTWTFDDPNSVINSYISSPANPNAFHTFSKTGTYNVCLSFQESGLPLNNICKRVQIGQCCNGIISTYDTCLQNSIPFSILTGATISSITWNFDDPSSGANNSSTSLSPKHMFSSTGTYSIRSIINFPCGIDTLYKTLRIINCDSTNEFCELYAPNSFTPDGDGINDNFHSSTICKLEHYELLIFNRWGGQIFKTSNQLDKWDGKYKGSNCSVGVYSYRISYKSPSLQPKNVYESITLLR